jgi:hypothetical protein
LALTCPDATPISHLMNLRITPLAPLALLIALPLMALACGSDATGDDPTPASDIAAPDQGDATSAQGQSDAVTDDDASAEPGDASAEPGDATQGTPEDDAATTDTEEEPPVEDDTVTGPTESDTEAPTCTPACDDKACGEDGCGGSCGDCADGEACTVEGICAAFCIPACDAMSCGDDGCGGSCGDCADGETCTDGVCMADCVPACDGMNCGDDSCGGSCGECAEGELCTEGMCMAEAEGACNNAADLAVISTADVAQLSQDAAFACLQGFSVDLQCVIDTLVEDSGMTLECAGCFGEQAVCVASNCAFQCFSPASQSCEDCRNANCTPLFEPCAGIAPIQ